MGKKKYIKNSNGVTMSVTTDTLGLEKPLLNENYDIDVHNRNMDKIDEDLKPIDDSYIIELFQHDGDTTNPRDYYTKVEADEKFASKEEANNALNKANEAFQRGDNVKTQLVDKLISEGLNVSTNNTFEELIGNIALGKKWASGNIEVPTMTEKFLATSNQYISARRLEVRSLSFKPSVVLIKTNATKLVGIAFDKGNSYIISAISRASVDNINFYKYDLNSTVNLGTNVINSKIYDDGFLLYTQITDVVNLEWVAFE